MKNKMNINCRQELETADLFKCSRDQKIKGNNHKRRIGFIWGVTIHTISLILGTVISIWDLIRTINLYGIEPLWNTIDRGGTSLGLLILTVAFVAILLKNGYSILALPIYCSSYFILGITLHYWLLLAAKDFGDAAPDELFGQYLFGSIWIAVVIAVIVVGIRVYIRSAKRLS